MGSRRYSSDYSPQSRLFVHCGLFRINLLACRWLEDQQLYRLYVNLLDDTYIFFGFLDASIFLSTSGTKGSRIRNQFGEVIGRAARLCACMQTLYFSFGGRKSGRTKGIPSRQGVTYIKH